MKLKPPKNSICNSPLESFDTIKDIRSLNNDSSLFQNAESTVNKVTEIIKHETFNISKSSFSICLDGSWGSGKTSLVNFIKSNTMGSKTTNNKPITWITFAPWSLSNSSDIITEFFHELSRHVLIEHGINLEPDIGKYIDYLTPVIEKNEIATVAKSLTPKKNLKELRETLKTRMEKIFGTIVILIDDIDRLAYDEVNTVLKLIRQNSDFPNIIYILPFDYERVASLVCIGHSDNDQYRYFLKKIIDLRISLDPYTYEELEGIFHYILVSSKLVERNEEHLLNASKVLAEYVKEFSRHEFSEIYLSTLRAKEANPELKPMYAYFEPLYTQYFKKTSLSYPDDYPIMDSQKDGEREDSIQSLYLQHAGGHFFTLNQLVIKIMEPLLRAERYNIIKKRHNGKFRDLTNGTSLQTDLLTILAQSNNKGDERFSAIIATFNRYRSSGLIPLDYEKTVNEILLDIKNYTDKEENIYRKSGVEHFPDLEEQRETTSIIKKWIVHNITPRDIKHLAGNIKSYIGNNEIVRDKINEVCEIAVTLARQQA